MPLINPSLCFYDFTAGYKRLHWDKYIAWVHWNLNLFSNNAITICKLCFRTFRMWLKTLLNAYWWKNCVAKDLESFFIRVISYKLCFQYTFLTWIFNWRYLWKKCFSWREDRSINTQIALMYSCNNYMHIVFSIAIMRLL